MNIKRLKGLKQIILDNPDNSCMEDFHLELECKTLHCIAGWAEIKYGRPIDFINYPDIAVRAKKVLDIPNDKLFYTIRWPRDLYYEYLDGETPIDKAEIMAKAIDSYIKTEGWRDND